MGLTPPCPLPLVGGSLGPDITSDREQTHTQAIVGAVWPPLDPPSTPSLPETLATSPLQRWPSSGPHPAFPPQY